MINLTFTLFTLTRNSLVINDELDSTYLEGIYAISNVLRLIGYISKQVNYRLSIVILKGWTILSSHILENEFLYSISDILVENFLILEFFFK